MPYPCRSRSDSVRRINMSSEPGNESFFCALRPIPRILSLQDQIIGIKFKRPPVARQPLQSGAVIQGHPLRRVLLQCLGFTADITTELCVPGNIQKRYPIALTIAFMLRSGINPAASISAVANCSFASRKDVLYREAIIIPIETARRHFPLSSENDIVRRPVISHGLRERHPLLADKQGGPVLDQDNRPIRAFPQRFREEEAAAVGHNVEAAGFRGVEEFSWNARAGRAVGPVDGNRNHCAAGESQQFLAVGTPADPRWRRDKGCDFPSDCRQGRVRVGGNGPHYDQGRGGTQRLRQPSAVGRQGGGAAAVLQYRWPDRPLRPRNYGHPSATATPDPDRDQLPIGADTLHDRHHVTWNSREDGIRG